ncbi:DNA topoisomerase III [Heyndrickxia sporothermodurans]|uniref:DNA topoisomerase n=1 Tax=Heyndrickxia sporothermodurans TaxID=46224 RepID=A0A150LHH2_9BACI|nr:DNA topoisomerase [Heyndrickxia sporothermodurans]KYD11459.1 DNA topoisomerase III [Heyndrickxia sporothermodurans]
MKELFVCEKPDVARKLANAISGGYKEAEGHYIGNDERIYTFAFGHLVSCVSPDSLNEDWGWKGNVNKLPFFIKNIPLTVINNPGVKKQFKIITSLLKKSELVYIATDAGREGEHIFRKIYSLSGVDKPLKRMWIQDMTTEGIKKAFNNAKDGSLFEGLALAGKLREESDLLIGMNGTMLISKLSKSSKVLSLGRVQTPTLAMVVNRDKLIENFAKVVHYSVAAIDKNGIKYELVLDKDTHLTKDAAKKILELLGNRTGLNIDTKNKEEKPEKLFDLTGLQKFMNEKHKWSADKTLKTTEALYLKKYVTYPRTNSQYIANDSELPELLEKHADHEWVNNIITKGYKIESSFVDPSKVTDHEAIIITSEVANNLTGDEATLYNVIFTRFLAAFYPYAVKEETTALFNDQDFTFKAKETVLVNLGWRELYGENLQESSLKNTNIYDVGEYSLVEKETKPPKRYTEATLLHDMQHAAKFLDEASDKKMMKAVEGIGTVATRAAIIEKLVERGFIEKKKNQVISTSLGRELIEMMPEDFSLYSVKLTALFETMLAQVENGELSEETFYEELEGLIIKTAGEIRENIKVLSSAPSPTKEVIAQCPKCKKPIYENSKAYSCSGFKHGCKVVLWKNGIEKLGKKSITKNEAAKLLLGKKVNVTLKSRHGKSYKKEVVFNSDKNWIEFAEK